MAQGILGYQYEADRSADGVTALAGLPVCLDLAVAMGLAQSMARHIRARRRGPWQDGTMATCLVLLNVAGGSCADDLRTLGKDVGFGQVLDRARFAGLPRAERRRAELAFRKARRKGRPSSTVPSPSSALRYLERFHDEAEEAKRVPGRAFIPAPNEHLRGLYRVRSDMVARIQEHSPESVATLDEDATVVGSHKLTALPCYKGYRAYQPLNVWWAEQGIVLHSEFRDGNVPAGYEQLRVLQEALDMLPPGVERVRYRADGAGYEVALVKYLAEGGNARFGPIDFAVSCDVGDEFKKAVAELGADDWKPLQRDLGDGHLTQTEQEWAEVCYVPNWVGHSKKGPPYRFLAIREPLQRELPGIEDDPQRKLPFQTIAGSNGQRFKLFGVLTNRADLAGDAVIWWHRERCGKSEQAHDIMKHDLSGGQLPSEHFGANAAWWGIMTIAFDFVVLLKRLALPPEQRGMRMKALRFSLLNIAGRVVRHAGTLLIKIATGHPALEILVALRRRILDWAGRHPVVNSS